MYVQEKLFDYRLTLANLCCREGSGEGGRDEGVGGEAVFEDRRTRREVQGQDATSQGQLLFPCYCCSSNLSNPFPVLNGNLHVQLREDCMIPLVSTKHSSIV